MAILKCKMCGGDLNIEDGMTVAECEYCGSKQTVPTADNEKKMTLFARANRLRAACEFDKAAGVYESIVADFPEEAEAYWGLVLCKYGIEYVDDPATGKKIPTCHRSSFDSIMDDSDFEQVMENADAIARRVYREEAKTIENIRKGILEVSSKEEPYDIFICYKETDENGNRTIDSVIAQNIYSALTDEGYRVFFARISLEDKLGTAYEPYIFAALNSAKVMLAVGTDYDYYNAVWVKNEWSRFLALIAKGEKKTLIPCYKDIDAYDIPKEFKHLQAQDMGKVGAMQDLLRGIGKLIPKKKQESAPQMVVIDNSKNETQYLLKRMFMYLEDGEWDKANEYTDRILDKDPENAEAYLGKLMVNLEITHREKLISCKNPEKITSNNNYEKVLRFGDETLISELNGYLDSIKGWRESVSKKDVESQIISLMSDGEPRTIPDIMCACPGLEDASYEMASQFVNGLNERGLFETFRNRRRRFFRFSLESAYNTAKSELDSAKTTEDFVCAKRKFEEIRTFRDSNQMIAKCNEAIKQLSLDELQRIRTEYSAIQTVHNTQPIIDRLTPIVASLKNRIDNYNNARKTESEQKKNQDSYESRISEIEKELAGLGRFAFSKKNALNAELEKLKSNLTDTKMQMESVGRILSATNIDEINDEYAKLTEELSQARTKLDEAYKLCNGKELKSEITQYGEIVGDILYLSNSIVKDGAFELSSDLSLFLGDSSVRCIVFPDNVIRIGNHSFILWKNIVYFIFPEGLKIIDEVAFCCCINLIGVDIPATVDNIDRFAFDGCSDLNSITVDLANKKYDSRENCNAIIETETNTLLIGCNSTVIPDSVTGIGTGAFMGCSGLTSIAIPDSVTKIGDKAFANCRSLSEEARERIKRINPNAVD